MEYGIIVAVALLLLLAAGCIAAEDPGFGKVLNETRAVVEEAKRFRITDPSGT